MRINLHIITQIGLNLNHFIIHTLESDVDVDYPIKWSKLCNQTVTCQLIQK